MSARMKLFGGAAIGGLLAGAVLFGFGVRMEGTTVSVDRQDDSVCMAACLIEQLESRNYRRLSDES